MTKKHEVKKQEIIKTAFSEWGKIGFHNTSLTAVSEKMKISKAAFYRYFKSKDDLFNEMVNIFLKDFIKVSYDAIKDYQSLNEKNFIRQYIKCNFTFFADNQEYFHFFSLILMKNILASSKEYLKKVEDEEKAFLHILTKSSKDINSENIATYIRFIYAAGIFIIATMIKKKCGKKEVVLCEDIEIDEAIEKIYEITTKGFLNNPQIKKMDFENIEKISTVQKNEIPEKDKIFNAITSVVAKEGIWDASIDKIAKEAGMSKSNFYFYFKNKEDMFENMILKEITVLNGLFNEKRKSFTDFEDVFYCNIIVSASSILQDKRIMYFFNWLHAQRFHLNALAKNKKINSLLFSRYGFLEKALESKVLNSHGLNLELLASFFNMQIVKEILLANLSIESDYFKEMRLIFKLILKGIIERN